MKTFREENGYWEDKVNFVDDNNVLVGYNLSQCCCENADWFVADSIADKMPDELNQPEELLGFNFDAEFYKQLDYLEYSDMEYNALDAGAVAVFKLVNGKEEKFLHLFNCHNGYYSHGFEVEVNGEEINSGYL